MAGIQHGSEPFNAEVEFADLVGTVLQLADASIQACDPAAERLLGYTAEQLIGTTSFEPPWQTICPDGSDFQPEDHPAIVSLKTGQPCQNVEMGFYQPSGNLVWLLLNSTPLFQTQAASPYAVVVTLRASNTPQTAADCSPVQGQELEQFHLPQAKAQLRQMAERMSIAQRFAKAGLWDWNVLTNEVYWSPDYYELHGIDLDVVPAYEAWLASIAAEDRERVDREVQTAVAGQHPIRVEFRLVHPERGLCWFLTIGNTLYDAVGQPIRATGISLDITDRVFVEEELRQKNAILTVINESAPTPIFVKNREGQIIFANPATLEVLGKSAAEVIGFRDCDLYPHAEDAVRVMENDRRIMESGLTEVVEESPDGVRTFLGMKSPYRNEWGEVIGLIGISNDITDRVQLERDRERILQQEQGAREAAETANRIKDEFLAVLSHELRTPLNPILGWTRLLRSGKVATNKIEVALETIDRNAKLQAQLIEDLLDVSRILQGKLSLTAALVDWAATVAAAIETVQLAAEAKAILLQVSLKPTQVTGDGGRLQQVVWNLLSNAVKFTPTGGQVAVRLEHQETVAQLTISDTGKGITADFLPYVFDYFRQEDGATTRKFGGLGLGLAIVRQMVELHGGTVQVDSPGEGQGSTFTVTLPMIKDESASTAEEQLHPSFASPRHANTLHPLQGLQVLVVDDEIDSRDFVAFVLEAAGAKVVSLGSAIEALQAVAQVKPDILISDIGMPEMDGYMLMQKIRAHLSRKMPAIALTAYARESDQQQALAAGFTRHLPKPIEPDQLVTLVATLVDESN